MENKPNKKLFIILAILIVLVFFIIFTRMYKPSSNNKGNDLTKLQTIEYSDTLYIKGINDTEVPKSFFYVKKEDDKLFAGDIILDSISSSKAGELMCKFSGTLTETYEDKDEGILSLYLELPSKKDEDELEPEMPYSLEFEGSKYEGILEFSGDFESKIYKGTLLRK